MIFRIFQNVDPKTGQQLTKGDVFVSGDAQVVQGCPDFSIGTFVWSRAEVPEQYEGILLTDLADEKIRFYFNGEASGLVNQEPLPPALSPPAGIIDQPKPEPKTAIVGPGPLADPTPLPDTLPPPEATEEKAALTPGMTEEKKTAEEEDWLDKLDNHKELQSDEENELKELEKFHETDTAKAPAAAEPPADANGLPPAPPETAAAPAAPDSAFPSEEPVVETPAAIVKPPATKSAQAPKASPTPSGDSAEGLTPL
jgi:predicted  nucleic acid-binding Zn-ribbon protein